MMNTNFALRGIVSTGFRSMRFLQSGVALVSVLWVTAALSVLVLSMSHVARIEARAQAQHGERAQAIALTDGALRFAAAVLMTSAERPLAPAAIKALVDGHDVDVTIISAAGLVNVNHASEELLSDLFTTAAELDRSRADTLARNIVEWRAPVQPAPGDATGGERYRQPGEAPLPRGGFFRRPEDLRQVAGLDSIIYDRISGLISVARAGGDGVNPLAAPADVLAVLAGGQSGLVDWLVGLRDDVSNSAAELDVSQFGHADARHSSIYRLSAVHVDALGREWRRVAWLELPPARVYGPIWRWRHVEPIIVVPRRQNQGVAPRA